MRYSELFEFAFQFLNLTAIKCVACLLKCLETTWENIDIRIVQVSSSKLANCCLTTFRFFSSLSYLSAHYILRFRSEWMHLNREIWRVFKLDFNSRRRLQKTFPTSYCALSHSLDFFALINRCCFFSRLSVLLWTTSGKFNKFTNSALCERVIQKSIAQCSQARVVQGNIESWENIGTIDSNLN